MRCAILVAARLGSTRLARKPLLDDVAVATTLTIGPRAAKPLQLDIPLFVSDMSFGALSIGEIALGVTAVNLFGGLTYDAASDDFLMDIKVGGSALFADSLRVALDVHLAGSLHLGFVYEPIPTFALRVGLISRSGVSVTAGLGVNVEGFLLDYAYATHALGGTHRVSLTLDFSSLDITALSRSMRRLLP